MKRRAKIFFIFSIVALVYFFIFDRTPQGTDCKKSDSPDGKYVAELCILNLETWPAYFNYVARLTDKKTGKLLVQSTFGAFETSINWSNGGAYSDDGGKTPKQYSSSVYFQNGGDDGDGSSFKLPPTLWERLLAMRPRLPWNR